MPPFWRLEAAEVETVLVPSFTQQLSIIHNEGKISGDMTLAKINKCEQSKFEIPKEKHQNENTRI